MSELNAAWGTVGRCMILLMFVLVGSFTLYLLYTAAGDEGGENLHIIGLSSAVGNAKSVLKTSSLTKSPSLHQTLQPTTAARKQKTKSPSIPPTLWPTTLNPTLLPTSLPSEIKSTLQPTVVDDRARFCPRNTPVFENPDCETNLNAESIFPFDSVPYDFVDIYAVHVLLDTDWGFTCNKLEILTGAMYNVMKHPKSINSSLALGPVISNVVKNLDLKFISRDFPILLDCNICKDMVNCHSMVQFGKIYPGGVFPIFTTYRDSDMYWFFGPSALGFSVPLAKYILPSEVTRRSVEKTMLAQKVKTLGIHRRDIDGWCYDFLGRGPSEYECAFNDKINQEIALLSREDTRTLFQKKNYAKLKELETIHPMLMTCNYSLDAEQQGIFSKAWPQVFSPNHKKFHVLFTTDSNDPAGDKKLLASNVIQSSFQLNEAPDGRCTNERHAQRPHRFMLKEMYALTLADYHMANPSSSCDVIVVHWRTVLGRPKGSSFPPDCYDGQYETTKLTEWEKEMPFYSYK